MLKTYASVTHNKQGNEGHRCLVIIVTIEWSETSCALFTTTVFYRGMLTKK